MNSDLHVHMNYGGTYRNTPAHLVEQAEAEDLDIVNDLIVNKEQRFPDIAYNGTGIDPASKPDALVVHGQEFHTSYWGHRGVLNLQGSVLLPGYAGYPNTAAASLYPMNVDVYDMGHAKNGVVGAVHPFDEVPDPFANRPQRITDELPVDVALGKLDYMEIVGFSDHRSTAAVWYRLLNLGFRIPAGAGTDAMANYASLRGPVGMNRVYARAKPGLPKMDAMLDALKKGRTFATNGPLLDFSLGGTEVGGELKFEGPQAEVPFKAALRSIVPLISSSLFAMDRWCGRWDYTQRSPRLGNPPRMSVETPSKAVLQGLRERSRTTVRYHSRKVGGAWCVRRATKRSIRCWTIMCTRRLARFT